jgi:hypothetical protein
MIDLTDEELESIRKSLEMSADIGGCFCSIDLLYKLGFKDNDYTIRMMKEELEQEQKVLSFRQTQEQKLKKILLKGD